MGPSACDKLNFPEFKYLWCGRRTVMTGPLLNFIFIVGTHTKMQSTSHTRIHERKTQWGKMLPAKSLLLKNIGQRGGSPFFT